MGKETEQEEDLDSGRRTGQGNRRPAGQREASLCPGLLQEHRLRHKVTLPQPEKFFRLIPNDNLLKYKDAKDKDGFVPKLTGNTATRFAHYRLKVTTSPNDAVYEVGTRIRLDGGSKQYGGLSFELIL